MIKEVHRYDEDVVIAEFKNGIGVMYGKKQDEVLYAPLRQESGFIDFDVLNIVTKEPEYSSLPAGFDDAVDDFAQKSYQAQLKQKIPDQFGKVVEELELVPHAPRDWKHIGTSLAAGLLTPIMLITVPLLCAYAAANRDESEDKSGDGALGMTALTFAPVIMPAMAIKELKNPTTKYFQMKKADTVVMKNKGSLPAIDYIQGDLNRFYSMGVCFSSGDNGTITVYDHHVTDNYGRKNYYAKATQFLNISPEINNEMNRLLEERAAFPKVLKDFTAELNRENQEALLKSIGFI